MRISMLSNRYKIIIHGCFCLEMLYFNTIEQLLVGTEGDNLDQQEHHEQQQQQLCVTTTTVTTMITTMYDNNDNNNVCM